MPINLLLAGLGAGHDVWLDEVLDDQAVTVAVDEVPVLLLLVTAAFQCSRISSFFKPARQDNFLDAAGLRS